MKWSDELLKAKKRLMFFQKSYEKKNECKKNVCTFKKNVYPKSRNKNLGGFMAVKKATKKAAKKATKKVAKKATKKVAKKATKKVAKKKATKKVAKKA